MKSAGTLILALLVLMVISLLGFWGLEKVTQEVKKNLAQQLQVSLNSIVKTVEDWAHERKLLVEMGASDPSVRRAMLELIRKIQSKPGIKPEEMRQTPELQFLRSELGRVTQKYGFIGFVAFDRSGLQVAALLDEPVGRRDLMERSDFFERALAGETVISVPFPSEVDLPDVHGHFKKDWPTMFVAAPVYDDQNKVAGVLSFRLRPETNFTDLFIVARPGSTGEAYAFNQQGTLLTQSRFDEQLRSIGLLSNSPERISILNVSIRNPGGDMTQGFVPETPRDQQPLTLMAESAIRGETGVNVNGYNDYRGVPVVGAWTWLDDFQIGITQEIDVKEALAPLQTLTQTFLLIWGLLLGSAGLGFIQYHRKKIADEKAQARKRESMETARRMASIFQGTIDGIIIMDHEGTIESFNPGAEKIFGYSREEVVGKNVKMLMPEPYQSEHDGYLQRYAETGQTHILGRVRELVGLRKDGEMIFIELSANEMLLESGVKFTGTLRDITERKKMERQMLDTQQQAENASQAKSQFLSQMSHELRTPMNAILGFAQIMKGEPLVSNHAVLKECGTQILKAGNHLMAMINQILDLAQIETGTLEVSLEPVELGPLVREVCDMVRPLAAKQKIILENHISENSSHTLWADPTALKQVLLNLVSNAIQFNRDGGAVTLSCQPEDDARLAISVADTGKGLSPEEQKKLFEPFSRLHPQQAGKEGAGIGLAIVKKLMDSMKGKVSVTSEEGKGSTFTLNLPLSRETAIRSTGEGEGLSKKNESPHSGQANPSNIVLYIEDNPANMFLVKEIMAAHRPDLELHTSPRGTTGLELARQLQPGLILLDMNLPGLNGLDLYLHLQQSKSTRHIPVVAVSANAVESAIEKALSLGIDQYLTKPINIRKFLETLGKFLPEAENPDKTSQPKKENGRADPLTEEGRKRRET